MTVAKLVARAAIWMLQLPDLPFCHAVIWLHASRFPWRALLGLADTPPQRSFARRMAQKSGLSALGISETDASKAMLFSAQMVSSIAPARVR